MEGPGPDPSHSPHIHGERERDWVCGTRLWLPPDRRKERAGPQRERRRRDTRLRAVTWLGDAVFGGETHRERGPKGGSRREGWRG